MKEKFQPGDLVEIIASDTKSKAYNNLLNGKIGLIVNKHPKITMLDIWYVFVEGKITFSLEENLRRIKLND
jgi:ATP-dependent exoDNAse (exonuclease V) alpha subunit